MRGKHYLSGIFAALLSSAGRYVGKSDTPDLGLRSEEGSLRKRLADLDREIAIASAAVDRYAETELRLGKPIQRYQDRLRYVQAYPCSSERKQQKTLWFLQKQIKRQRRASERAQVELMKAAAVWEDLRSERAEVAERLRRLKVAA